MNTPMTNPQPYNPYMPNAYASAMNYTFAPSFAPHYDIIQVKGKQGVDAFQMAPNSKVLLLDETAPVVWLVQTDGAGYKTPTPYKLTPFEEQPQVDLNNLLERVKRLEEQNERQSNFKPNRQQQRQQRKQQSNSSNDAANTAGQTTADAI